MAVESPEELAIAHLATADEALAYLVIATPHHPLLSKQACILRDRGFSHAVVMGWLYHKVLGTSFSPSLVAAIEQHLASL